VKEKAGIRSCLNKFLLFYRLFVSPMGLRILAENNEKAEVFDEGFCFRFL